MAVTGPGEPQGSTSRPGGPPVASGTGARGHDDLRAEAAAGIARMEGYLLAQHARTEAAEAGAAFAGRFPWLGPHEAEEIARVFAQEHLALRRRMFQAAVVRADELRREYSDRYACLRRRLVTTALVSAAALGAATALVWTALARTAG
ncbi:MULTISPECIES: hypothetical protein [unclassified Streptomyces]|uniref:hypothetical protein n=1 Tax=unclassified Streptomyces TaxID=2593676 RepID=UPI0036C3D286